MKTKIIPARDIKIKDRLIADSYGPLLKGSFVVERVEKWLHGLKFNFYGRQIKGKQRIENFDEDDMIVIEDKT